MIEEALFSRLSGFAGLSSLVGDRIYPLKLPQKPTLPAVVYQRISGARVRSLLGSSGLASPRFQFDSYAAGAKTSREVSEQIRLALQGFSGTVAGVRITGITFEGDRDFYYDDTGLYRRLADYFIWHNEAKP